jgi:hypothetical protein
MTSLTLRGTSIGCVCGVEGMERLVTLDASYSKGVCSIGIYPPPQSNLNLI